MSAAKNAVTPVLPAQPSTPEIARHAGPVAGGRLLATSQRDLVLASLARCPDRSAKTSGPA